MKSDIRQSTHRRFLQAAVSVVFLISLWVLLSQIWRGSILATPTAVASALTEMASTGELWRDLRASLLRVLLGLSIAATAGILLGILTGYNSIANATLGATAQVLRPIPVLAMIPFAIYWMGIGEASRISLIAWGAFFPIWLNTHLGVRSVEIRYLRVARSLGVTGQRLVWMVIFPAAAGHIMTGLRAAVGVSFLCVVAAEMAGASEGLGFRIDASHLAFRVDRMTAALLILGTCGWLADTLVAWGSRRVAPWYWAVRTT